MPVVSSNTWKDYLLSHESNDDANKNLDQYNAAIDPSLTDDTLVKELANDINGVILYTEGDRINILHSVKNFGGTRSRPVHKLGALVGLGPQAHGVLIDMQNVSLKINTKTPSMVNLMNCTSKAEIEALNKTAKVLKGPIYFPLAPFLWESVMRIVAESNGDPVEVIIQALADARKFEEAVNPPAQGEETAADDELGAQAARFEDDKSAYSHAGRLAMYAFGVMQAMVDDFLFLIRPDDTELADFCRDRHRTCLLPAAPANGVSFGGSETGGDTSAVFSQLSESISRQTESMVTITEIQRDEAKRKKEKDSREKDRTKDFHPSSTTMIKMASAPDCETTPTSLPASYLRVANCKTAGTADTEIQLQFSDLGLGDVFFAHGTTLALYNGNLIYSREDAPNNFSAFCLCQQQPSDEIIGERAILLHLMKDQGRGKTHEELLTSTKQCVRTPSSISDLQRRLAFIKGASSIVFGHLSVLTDNLGILEKKVNKHLTTFLGKQAADFAFSTKFLFAVDSRIQRWLRECRGATSRDEVDDSIIDFNSLIGYLLDNMFQVDLPSAFKIPNDTAQEPSLKKRRVLQGMSTSPGEKEDRFVRNEDQCPAFKLKDNEKWKDFCGAFVDERPDWSDSGVKMCARFHIKGDCFSDCRYIDSHVACNKIPSAQKSDMIKYLKKVRRE